MVDISSAPMTRAVRLGCLLASIFGASAFAGCGTDTTLDLSDSGTGITIPDTGTLVVHDSGIVQFGDGGMVTPFDSGLFPEDTGGPTTRPDGGRFMRPDGGTMTPPGGDSGTTVGIMCGGAVCATGETCCITRGAGGMMIAESCTAPGACMGAALACDGPEDCATGQACCGSVIGGSAGAMCTSAAMCTRGRLCHLDGDCSTGDTCCSFMGLNVCSPFCP